MKIIKGIKTILRLPIQSIGKAVDRFMVCFFPRSRTYLVHTINRYRWLSNALRRCAGKPLFFGKNQLPVEDLFSSLSRDIQSLAIKIILKIGKFVLCHQKIKKICKYLLRACLQTSYRSQISEAARHTKAAKTSASLS